MRAAVDIGGTFTDVVLHDEDSGDTWTAKVHSIPEDPAHAFLNGLQLVLENAGAEIQNVDALVHGTTIVTNALLEGKTASTGLLVTEGFRDLLEIGRQVRPKLYDLFADRLPPLVPRHLVGEVRERVDSRGEVILPLDEEQARARIEALAESRVESLAITLLFSFLYPSHEERLLALAREYFPEHFIFLSSQVSPEFREYERASTTVVAAAVAPRVVTYLGSIEDKLNSQGWDQESFALMHSGGGLLPSSQAVQRPHTLIESGPAAGVLAAAELARRLDLERVIAFDMGGTTAKAGLVLDGGPRYTSEYEVGGEMHQAGRSLGSGYPVRFPMIDVAECGAGAGSLAWIDSGGHLKVGPQSAGADPGPACYGRGGEQPTITDAYLCLGLLSPESFLGGEMTLDPSLAARVIESHVAEPLGLSLEEAARGILDIADANMLRILRLVSVQRGYDPRDFGLVVYGGAGPLHATALASQMSIRQVILPRYPALFSAFGLLSADPSADFTQTVMLPLDPKSLPQLNAALEKLNQEAQEWFDQTDVLAESRQLQAQADLRYIHQNYELTIDLVDEVLNTDNLEHILEAFHEAHQQAYGHSAPDESVQAVNLRLRAIYRLEKPEPKRLEAESKSESGVLNSAQRSVWLGGGWYECEIYNREDLATEHYLDGPLIVQEREATTLVEAGWELSVDQWGNIILEYE